MLKTTTILLLAITLAACAPDAETVHEEHEAMPTMSSSEFSTPTIHIGVVVTDLERAIEFYTGIIGMKEVGGFDLDADFGSISGLTGDLPLSVKTLKLEDSEEATQWKLMSFGTEVERDQYKYIQDDIGMQYTTILVENLRPFIERIEEANVPMLGETPIQLDSGVHFVLIQDPDGTFIELIGPMGE
jgi:catechol 2,3-dioxygenase-like lactoylglutathione lyase family enzyme